MFYHHLNSLIENGEIVKKAWAMNKDQAIGKGQILAEFYRDDNGQSSTLIINE